MERSSVLRTVLMACLMGGVLANAILSVVTIQRTQELREETQQALQALSDQTALAVQTMATRMTDLNERLTGTEEDLARTKEDVVVKVTALRDATDQMIRVVNVLDTQLKDVQTKLGLQSQKLTEIEQKEERIKANIEKAKRSTVQLLYEIVEDDCPSGFRNAQCLQKFTFSCSGVIYRGGTDVFILTAQHCVNWRFNFEGLNEEGAWRQIDKNEDGPPEIVSEKVTGATLGSGFADSRIVWTAPLDNDLAVVTFPATGTYEVATLSRTLPTTGEGLIVVGHPLGLQYSVSQGIVSAVRQDTGAKPLYYIQTDAAINQGNSGGGLFRIYDNVVVGISSFEFSQKEGLNFAIATKTFFDTVNP